MYEQDRGRGELSLFWSSARATERIVHRSSSASAEEACGRQSLIKLVAGGGTGAGKGETGPGDSCRGVSDTPDPGGIGHRDEVHAWGLT
ncbi:unnamed protein product [Lampetra planeri]